MKRLVFFLFFLVLLNSCFTLSEDSSELDTAEREERYFSPAKYLGESTVRMIDGNSYTFAFTASLEAQQLADLRILNLPERDLLAKISRKSVEEEWTLEAVQEGQPWLSDKDPLPFLSLAELLSLPKSAVDEQWNTFLNLQGKRLEVHLKDAGQHIDVQIVQADFIMSTILRKDEGLF